MWRTLTGVVEAVLVADDPTSFVTRRCEEIRLEYGGIPGDLHFGLTKRAGVREPMYPRGTEIFNRRQVTVVSAEECAAIAEALGVPEVLPEWLGANLVLRGIPDLTRLPEGSRIVFSSGAGLLCEGENLPCTQAGQMVQKAYPDEEKLAPRFVKAALGRRGIVCVVERPGRAVSGEEVRVYL
ncbi:MAG: MOSC domain-containing protein, partial [Alicyclobacillaceae bacterium]|nr:MOSC domain-containing protein [Alicyclobacillaceae bacterium]